MKEFIGANGETYRVFGDDEKVLETCDGCDFVLYEDGEGVLTMVHHDDWCPVMHPSRKEQFHDGRDAD